MDERDILPDPPDLIESLPERAIDDPPAEIERASTEPPPAPELSADVESAQRELVEVWNTLGQLGVAFTDLSTRIAKLEKFIGLGR